MFDKSMGMRFELSPPGMEGRPVMGYRMTPRIRRTVSSRLFRSQAVLPGNKREDDVRSLDNNAIDFEKKEG
jgi:hypothetical protein